MENSFLKNCGDARFEVETGFYPYPLRGGRPYAEKTGVVVTISIHALGEEDDLVTPLRTAI